MNLHAKMTMPDFRLYPLTVYWVQRAMCVNLWNSGRIVLNNITFTSTFLTKNFDTFDTFVLPKDNYCKQKQMQEKIFQQYSPIKYFNNIHLSNWVCLGSKQSTDAQITIASFSFFWSQKHPTLHPSSTDISILSPTL